jgi:hypothetical protein
MQPTWHPDRTLRRPHCRLGWRWITRQRHRPVNIRRRTSLAAFHRWRVLEPDHEPATPTQTAGRVIPADTVCVHPRPVLRATLAPRDPRGSAHKKTLLPTRNLPRSREEATTRRRQYRSNGSKTGTGETGEQAAPYDRPPPIKSAKKAGRPGNRNVRPYKIGGESGEPGPNRLPQRASRQVGSGGSGGWARDLPPTASLRGELGESAARPVKHDSDRVGNLGIKPVDAVRIVRLV